MFVAASVIGFICIGIVFFSQTEELIDIKKIVRPNILELLPYSSARDEFSGKEGIFLDANENPFECEVTCVDFSGTAAELLGIEPEDDES